MEEVIITGASRGIGEALARELAAPTRRLVLVARDRQRLDSLCKHIRSSGGAADAVVGDLSTVSGAAAMGAAIAGVTHPGATLVHNAGVWPSRRVLTADGLETAFAVNFVGPLIVQNALLAASKLSRVMVVSAGLIIKGRFDPARTPTGADFSTIRTYCSTKLCFAIASRRQAELHPNVDFMVLHPGVVRTELGARSGVLGAVLNLIKRRWEAPDVCAARLGRLLEQPQWSTPGRADWWIEETPSPWPAAADDPNTRKAVLEAQERYCAPMVT